jgi:hypothetical protein
MRGKMKIVLQGDNVDVVLKGTVALPRAGERIVLPSPDLRTLLVIAVQHEFSASNIEPVVVLTVETVR